MKRAVFLDRDGVINKAFVVNGVPIPPRNLIEIEVIAGVKESIKLLTRANFEVIVVTNQPDVARGTMLRETVDEINSYLGHELGISHFYTCFHDDPQCCDCRKPKPGLLNKAAKNLNLDLPRSFVIGDRWRDIEAGQSAGCSCLFVDYGYQEKSPILPFTRVFSLRQATQLILENANVTFS